jgi:hypothetical protein
MFTERNSTAEKITRATPTKTMLRREKNACSESFTHNASVVKHEIVLATRLMIFFDVL